jgi:methionine-rich copper-binding protein CopC
LAGALIAATFVAVLSTTNGAEAHAGYESSTPGDGEVVAEAPAVVEVRFGQEMGRSGGLPTLIVVNEAGDQVDLGAVLSDDDRTVITAELAPSLPDGRYTVIWHTLSDEDGEEAQGAFHFYVGSGPDAQPTGEATRAAATTPTASATPEDNDGDEDGDGVPLWLLVAGIAAGAVGGAAVGLVIGRRSTG